MKFIIGVLLIMYSAYLLFTTWGIGALSRKIEHEIHWMTCKVECDLYKRGRAEPRRMCRKYCN